MVEEAASLVAGIFAWTFLEYLIHGWLSHSFQTFASRLHAVHHRDPHAVFAIRAWIPLAIIWLTLILAFGWTAWAFILTGAIIGFACYEAIHYRIHFRRADNVIESYLRVRHLIHHNHHPDQCFGVTSALWDLVFGTEPTGAATLRLRESVSSILPLSGHSNLIKLYKSIPLQWIQDLASRLRTQ
jgi:sterol desaturase/sphingolipid hydroxylase (fatty acid hydroxylase superfamily)